MIKAQPWFERTFPADLPLALYPAIIERLRGTPARLVDRVAGLDPQTLVRQPPGRWSIQENVGHLGDLEPTWFRRVEQLLRGETELAPADLSNRATTDAGHNSTQITVLLERFRDQRFRLVSVLESADEAALHHAARHPRLGTLMRLVDVAFFVAEHDDHHLALMTGLLNDFSATR